MSSHYVSLYNAGSQAPTVGQRIPTMAANQSESGAVIDFYGNHPELRDSFPERNPHIEWVPDYETHVARQQRRMATESLADHVPAGWPEKVVGPEVWNGEDFKPENGGLGDLQWVVKMEEEHIQDIEKALDIYKKNIGSELVDINQSMFPLEQRTVSFLRKCSERIHKGDGLIVLRGLNPDKYSMEDNMILYAGLSSYIGNRRGIQSKYSNEEIIHVTDTGTSLTQNPMASYTNMAQPFHSDLGDLLGLYVLDTPATGGASNVASSAMIYNEIARTRPDLIHTLSEPWVFDSFGKSQGYYIRPILMHENGHVIFNYARRLFTGMGTRGRSDYLPGISEAQAEALDTIEFTARKVCVSMQLQRGDIQFQSNLATIHGRQAFEDAVENNRKRHLMRIWLHDDEFAWKLPEAMKAEWDWVFSTPMNAPTHVFPKAPTKVGAEDATASCS